MSLILTILTFAVFVGVSYLSGFMKKGLVPKAVPEGLPNNFDSIGNHLIWAHGRAPLQDAQTIVVLPTAADTSVRIEGYALPQSLYYHQGHTWVALQESGAAVVGLDDFASKLMGRPTSIKLPRVGERCRQGARGWILSRKGRILAMPFPLDGEVVAINERVLNNPEILTKEPYGNGWLAMVKPRELKRNLRNLLAGPIAMRWMEEAAADLRSAFSGKLGAVYQDGGLPKEGLADHFDEADWEKFADRFFMVERRG
jgi:glycine cleavage system H protein